MVTMEQSNDQAFRNAGRQRCRGIGNSLVDSAYRSIDIRDHWRTVKQSDEVAQLQSLAPRLGAFEKYGALGTAYRQPLVTPIKLSERQCRPIFRCK